MKLWEMAQLPFSTEQTNENKNAKYVLLFLKSFYFFSESEKKVASSKINLQ